MARDEDFFEALGRRQREAAERRKKAEKAKKNGETVPKRGIGGAVRDLIGSLLEARRAQRDQ